MAKKIECENVLDWLVESLRESVILPGEFTARTALEKLTKEGIQIGHSALQKRLLRQQEIGLLTSRVATINGSTTRIFRKA